MSKRGERINLSGMSPEQITEVLKGLLPSKWKLFYASGFTYRPEGNGQVLPIENSTGKVIGLQLVRDWKTNKAEWAKQ